MTTSAAAGIIILGAPRSGTTLLRRLVDAHPNIACPGETNVFAGCGRFLRSERIAEGVGIGVLDGLGYAGFSTSEILRRLREFAFSFHKEYAEKQGKPRWASKTAFDAFYLNEIEQLCGDHVYFICIQRHGLDVACSIEELCRKNGIYLEELHRYIVRYPRPLEAFAQAWVELATSIAALAKRRPQKAMTIAYEELITNTDVTMARVMAAIGEAWDPSFIEEAMKKRGDLGLGDWKTYGRKSIEASSIGRWKQLSRETISRLGTICNPTLTLCGYEPVEVQTERTADETHRRYEVGLLLQGVRRQSETAEKAAPGNVRFRTPSGDS